MLVLYHTLHTVLQLHKSLTQCPRSGVSFYHTSDFTTLEKVRKRTDTIKTAKTKLTIKTMVTKDIGDFFCGRRCFAGDFGLAAFDKRTPRRELASVTVFNGSTTLASSALKACKAVFHSF